jgi:hypothetical protein
VVYGRAAQQRFVQLLLNKIEGLTPGRGGRQAKGKQSESYAQPVKRSIHTHQMFSHSTFGDTAGAA